MPHLEPLKAIHNFSIESQLLYHAPLSFEPTYGQVPHDQMKGSLALAIEAAKAGDEDAEDIAAAVMDEEKEEAWLIDEEEMKVFVNSERWSLGTSTSTLMH